MGDSTNETPNLDKVVAMFGVGSVAAFGTRPSAARHPVSHTGRRTVAGAKVRARPDGVGRWRGAALGRNDATPGRGRGWG